MGKIAQPNGAGGASRVKIIITMTASDSASLKGQKVKITEFTTGAVVADLEYSGQPATVKVPLGLTYRVEAAEKIGYVVPAVIQGVALDDVNISINYQRCTRLGYRRKKAESEPASRIEYIHDAANRTPFTMDLSTGTPTYGDWKEFIDEVACPVMLNYDGTEAYELDRNDQTKKADGAPSDVDSTAFEGNAMVRFSGKWKWVHRSEDADYEYVIFADGRYDETYHAYAHTDENGNIKDRFYYAMYKGSFSNNRLRSIAGQAVMVSQTRMVEVDRAQANGPGWDTGYKSAWEYIADLLTLISKSDNGQGVFGTGRSASGNTSAISTGTTKTYGGFWGSSNQTSDVKVFWIEGFWGNVWEGLRGLVIAGGAIKTKMTPPYNFDGTGYHNTGKTAAGTSGGYTNLASVSDVDGFVPYNAAGSGTTYYCDGFWYNNAQTDYALVGGNWNHAALCGPRCVALSTAASGASANIGARLSYIPHAA